MYGVIGSAVILGILVIQLIKRNKLKTIEGDPIVIPPKKFTWWRYLLRDTIFGLGWALTGACPGPLFILLGNGVGVIAAALLGTFTYGKLRDLLPH